MTAPSSLPYAEAKAKWDLALAISKSSLRDGATALKGAEVEMKQAHEALDVMQWHSLGAWLQSAVVEWNRLTSITVRPHTPYAEAHGKEPPPRREKKKEYMTDGELDALL